MDEPFEAVIWGWLLVEDEVAKPTPGEMLSGLPLLIGPLGPRYQSSMSPVTIQATVEWVKFDEWNHRIATVVEVDGNRLVHIAPARSEDPMPALGSCVELAGFLSSLPFYDLEDLRDLAGLEDSDDLNLTEDWRVIWVRRVPDDDSLIAQLESAQPRRS